MLLGQELREYLISQKRRYSRRRTAIADNFPAISRVFILIILRQTYLNRSLFLPDAPLHQSDAIIVTAILLHCSIMVSTVPCLKPFFVSFNTGWGQGITNRNGQSSYFTPTGKSASANQSHVFSMNREEGDEINLTTSRQSQDSQHSQRLIIHQVQEWKVEEEYEMHSIRDRI